MTISDGKLKNISGWILPDGTWYPCEDWWHITALYDLKDQGAAQLDTQKAKECLDKGNEEDIRDFVASLGFIRFSRKMIDGMFCSYEQLLKLQELLELCEPEEELGILHTIKQPDGKISPLRTLSVERILKLRNPNHIFP